MRESYEDWQALGRDLMARRLASPMLIVADGARGLIKAGEQCWPTDVTETRRHVRSWEVVEHVRPDCGDAPVCGVSSWWQTEQLLERAQQVVVVVGLL